MIYLTDLCAYHTLAVSKWHDDFNRDHSKGEPKGEVVTGEVDNLLVCFGSQFEVLAVAVW